MASPVFISQRCTCIYISVFSKSQLRPNSLNKCRQLKMVVAKIHFYFINEPTGRRVTTTPISEYPFQNYSMNLCISSLLVFVPTEFLIGTYCIFQATFVMPSLMSPGCPCFLQCSCSKSFYLLDEALGVHVHVVALGKCER